MPITLDFFKTTGILDEDVQTTDQKSELIKKIEEEKEDFGKSNYSKCSYHQKMVYHKKQNRI